MSGRSRKVFICITVQLPLTTLPPVSIAFYHWSSNLAAYNRQSFKVRVYLFAILKWSVNCPLKACYNELKCLLKILSFKSLKNSIDFLGNSWKCKVNAIIMDTNNFNKHCSFKHLNLNLKRHTYILKEN